MFKLLLNFLFFVFLLIPSANSQQWKDTWSSFTNNPIVNKVLGTNIKCNNNENGTPEFFTFILNAPLSTIVLETISGHSLNFELNVIRNNSTTIEGEFFANDFYNLASKLDSEIAEMMKLYNYSLKSEISKMKFSKQKKVEKILMSHKGRFIFDRIEGDLAFIWDELKWGSTPKPPSALDYQREVKMYKCKKSDKKF